ncbi:MAG: glucosaminidase domain-containing protein [Bacteroidales bacterium]|nr:glucosaminidase domain-containing protein [Bacteroidales bacterium]
MKKLSVLILGALLLVSADILPQQEYIQKYSEIAVSEMLRTGIPSSITLAQGILESDSGRSDLAVNANNHFGIKCHNDWNGLSYRHDDETSQECFRAYSSPEESFVAHSDFLKERNRYAALFKLDSKDYKGWASGLSYCGYATDPMYPEKLVRIIEEYSLFDFDNAGCAVLEEEDRPELQGVLEESEAVSRQDVTGSEPVPDTPEVKKVRRYKTSELVVFTLGRPVYYKDGAKCIIAQPGETYESIARSCNLLNSEIRRFNSARRGEAPVPGDLVFVERQRKTRSK